MSKKFAILGVLLFGLSFSFNAYPDEKIKNFDMKWLKCTQNTQCAAITGSCYAQISVNKKFIVDAKRYYKSIIPKLDCNAITKIQLGKSKPACVEGACQLIPVTKK